MSTIEKVLCSFLNKHYNSKKKVLLGLSGGPDSLLLFHLLVKGPYDLSLKLGIAHVNHGWRRESEQEANSLAKLAGQYNLPFHLKKLNPSEIKGNLEAGCRQKRLQFFSELCQQFGYQAVILGHHAGDFIETVFKRILEGVSLPYIGGLREVTSMQDLCLWRPLLQFKKTEILEAVQKYQLSPFEDSTNSDPKFLRARFRTRIFPMLSSEFGKEIENSFEKIGLESKELKDYLEYALHEEIDSIQTTPFGQSLDLSKIRRLHSYEIKFLVKKFCEKVNFSLSRIFLDKIVEFLQKKSANKEIHMGSQRLHIDRGRLFLIAWEPYLPMDRLEIQKGKFNYGSWQVKVEETDQLQALTGWAEAWQGRCEIYLPQGKYHLGRVELNMNYPGNSPISKWWTHAKDPAFLRHFLPVIWNEKGISGEFLTGKNKKGGTHFSKGLKITLQIQQL